MNLLSAESKEIVRIVMTIRDDSSTHTPAADATGTTSVVLDVPLPGHSQMPLAERVHSLLPAAQLVTVARHANGPADLPANPADIFSRPRESTRRLTARENEVLELISKGLLNKEIAARLEITTETVRAHLKRIYTKLGVHTRTEAAVKHLRRERLVQSA